jgi:CubicO group peptidase (beta-lactamase class C family)
MLESRLLKSAILCVATLASAPVVGQDLDEHVQAWQQEHGVQGVVVAVRAGHRSDSAAAGVRNAAGHPLTTSDRLMAASVSKTFTAAAILELVSRGELRLDDRINEVSGHDFGPDLTVEDLLYHEAGIPEYLGGSLGFDVFLSEHADGREVWAVEEVRSFATMTEGHPDASFAYSNSHYVILGSVIEHTTGTPLHQALTELVFEPAGLDSPHLIHSAGDAPDANGHSNMLAGALGSPNIDSRMTTELASVGSSAGGVVLNADDLANWTRSWFSGSFVEGQLFREPGGGEAFGLSAADIQIGAGGFEVRYDRASMRLHGGDGLGVTALSIYDYEADIAVAILVNDDAVRSLGFGAEGFADSFALDLMELYRSNQ